MKTSQKKRRADELLIERGLAKDEAEALRLVLARRVFLPDRPLRHASELLPPETVLTLKQSPSHPYVSRGGHKLAAALKAFSVDPTGRVALDIGLSTGGFADCLLQHGAAKVVGLDVGHGLVAHSLRVDPRLTLLEKTNFLYFNQLEIALPISMVVADVSFVSIHRVMKKLPTLIEAKKPQIEPTKFDVICLHKPQFEVGRECIGKGGIVENEEWRLKSLEKTVDFGREIGLGEAQWIPSPILGHDGNQEYLVHWRV